MGLEEGANGVRSPGASRAEYSRTVYAEASLPSKTALGVMAIIYNGRYDVERGVGFTFQYFM